MTNLRSRFRTSVSESECDHWVTLALRYSEDQTRGLHDIDKQIVILNPPIKLCFDLQLLPYNMSYIFRQMKLCTASILEASVPHIGIQPSSTQWRARSSGWMTATKSCLRILGSTRELAITTWSVWVSIFLFFDELSLSSRIEHIHFILLITRFHTQM